MKDTNIVIQVGRLTRDSELAYTQSGYALLKFSIAVNRTKKTGDSYTDEPSFFDVVLFGKMGETIGSYLTKGKQVCVTGELEQQRWEKDGVKRSKVGIVANTVQLLGGKDEHSGSGTSNPATLPDKQDPASPQFEDDIPF